MTRTKTAGVVMLTIVLAGVLPAGGMASVRPGRISVSAPVEARVETKLQTDAIAVPRMLNYQGKLLNASGNPAPDTTYSVVFGLYAQASGGTAFWNETQTVRTKVGLFSVLLGSVTPISSVPVAGTLYLGMKVSSDPEMTPRLQIASAAYAYLAKRADTANYAVSAPLTRPIVPPVATAEILDTAVTMPKIARAGAAAGQVLKWTGSAWAPRNDSVAGGTGDNAWTHGGDSVLYTIRKLGIARGGASNKLWASKQYTHVNLGVACTTGVSNSVESLMTVSGGYHNLACSSFATAGGGTDNTARGQLSTIGGGVDNNAWGRYTTVGGGEQNTAVYDGATVGGGVENLASFTAATIGGGLGNTASGRDATVGGGEGNTASGYDATVGGGGGNTAGGRYATVGGGFGDTAKSDYCGVLSGKHNIAGVTAADSFAVVGGGAQNVARANYATVCGGQGDTASSFASAVGGGWINAASGAYAVVGGGAFNAASGLSTTVGGGYFNSARNNYTTVGGGSENQASGSCATIAGGNYNAASGDYYATVGGGDRNAASGRGATVGGGDGDTATSGYGGVLSGKHNIAGNSAADSFAVVGGGYLNRAAKYGSTVGGGVYNRAAYASYATVAGGDSNLANDLAAFVGGGRLNIANEPGSTVGGGLYNRAEYASFSTVAGGDSNLADDIATTVAGGCGNVAYFPYATVGGGRYNLVYDYGAVPGGYGDTVNSQYGFASNRHSICDQENSAAFTGSHTTAGNQVRAQSFSQGSGIFTMDHPADPMNRILNQYAVGSPELVLMYRGSAVIGADGRAEVHLPDYFDKVNRNPMVQLTGVGSAGVVYVAEEVSGNRFVIGGKPGTKVFWTVTGERKDESAELARIFTPVEQQKSGDLVGHSLDDDGLAGYMAQLEKLGLAGKFSFRTAEGRAQYEGMLKMLREAEQSGKAGHHETKR